MLKIGNDDQGVCAITWVVGNVCNFSCAYCPDELYNNTSRFPSSYESALEFIKKVVGLNKTVHIISFTGDVYFCSRFVGQDEYPFRLDNILYEEDIKTLDEHITCPEDYRPCLPDAAVPKYSPEYKGSL